MLNHLPQLVWTTHGADFHVSYVNKAFYHLASLLNTDLSGSDFWHNYLHPEDLLNLTGLHRRCFPDRLPWRMEARLKDSADEIWRWHVIHAIPNRLPGKDQDYICTAIDISALKKVELELKESEHRFRAMAEDADVLIAVSDASAKAVYFNKAWLELTGRSMEQLLGYGWTNFLHPGDIKAQVKNYRRSFRSKKTYSSEFRILNKDGGYTWLLARASPRIRADGSLAGYISSCMDITSRKKAEQEMLTQEKKLEQLVSLRTNELERSNSELQQFVHAVSHDLKEPVRKIKVFLSRILRDYEHELPGNCRQYLDRITSAAQRMSSMIDGTLHYALADADSGLEKVNLDHILKQVLEDLDLIVEQRRATINAQPLPIVEGIPTMFYQLFYNLLANSLKFGREGRPVVILIHADSFERDRQPMTRIRFTDNGIGFEMENKEKIFQTFVRLHSKDRYEGSGLGLSLCKKIVENHNGTIDAHSYYGEGAEFIIILPLSQKSIVKAH